LTISAVVSGCNTWELVAEFGCLKLDWLRKFFPYEKGTPSHDVLGEFYATLEPKAFGKCFMEFINTLAQHESEIIAIDGKTIRGVCSNHGKNPLHIVSAYCHKNRLCLTQAIVDDKSNEITAIPKLLDLMTIDRAIITIDAMGCQKEIAKKIIEKNADYVLQVKGNQKDLEGQVKKLFSKQAVNQTDTTIELDHGRIERRICRVIDNLIFLDGKQDWVGLKSIVEIESIVVNKKTNLESKSKRYYISSLACDAPKLNAAIRSHWSIENNLHWTLDVIFDEDHQLKRKGQSGENFNLIAKIAIGLLDAENTYKKSKPLKRFRAVNSDNYRETILKI
jgi:predicted transposase YbfD/YdcC